MNVLDPCCGSRMMWFDKSDQRTLFGDCRSEEHFLPDRQYTRHIEIKPDIKLDFRKLPFPDNSFKLIAFDPPHLIRVVAPFLISQCYNLAAHQHPHAGVVAPFLISQCYNLFARHPCL